MKLNVDPVPPEKIHEEVYKEMEQLSKLFGMKPHEIVAYFLVYSVTVAKENNFNFENYKKTVDVAWADENTKEKM